MADIFGTPGDDILNGTTDDDLIVGFEGDDQLFGFGGNDILVGSAGADVIDGGLGRDFVAYGGSVAGVTVNLLTSNHFGGDATGDTLISIENISGSMHDDVITGDAAVNFFIGFSGNDTLDGGAGNDFAGYAETFDSFSITESGGILTVEDTSSVFQDGTDTLTNIEFLTFSSDGSYDLNTLQTYTVDSIIADNVIDGTDGDDDMLFGTVGSDIINGQAGNDIINAIDGNDTLFGGDGDDILIGGSGADTLNGGDGIDQASYVNSAVGVTVNLTTFETSGGHAEGDFLGSIEGIVGSGFDDILTGDDGDNVLTGNAGNDIITTLTGNDTVDAGDGDDTIIINEFGSGLIGGGEGFDTVQLVSENPFVSVDNGLATNIFTSAGTTYGLASIERLDLNDTSGALTQVVLNGSSGADIFDLTNETAAPLRWDIYGGSGDDVYIGGDVDGTIFLYGSAGADTFTGGVRENEFLQYQFSDAGVNIDLSLNTASGGDAQGDIISGIDNVTGSSSSDVLIGNDGNNILGGAGGGDIIDGRGGDDVLTAFSFGATPTSTFTGGTGADEFAYFIFSPPGLPLTSFNTEITDFEVVDTIHIDSLFGAVAPTFIGQSVFSGTANELRFEADGGQTLVQLDADGNGMADGTITILNGEFDLIATDGGFLGSGISFTIAPLEGSSDNDVLIGTANGDVINGLAGNDVIEGGLGDDVINGGTGTDVSIYRGSVNGFSVTQLDSVVTVEDTFTSAGPDEGTDTLTNIEFLTFTTSGTFTVDSLVADNEIDGTAGAENIAGTVGADIINGLDGNDAINASNGNDSIFGGDGDDQIIGGNGADAINGGAGTDQARYANSNAAVTVNLTTGEASGGHAEGDLLNSIEDVFGSVHDDTLTGDSGDNVLTGFNGDDTLTGADGTNSLIGGNGDDTFIGGDGADFFNGGGGFGDTIDYSGSDAAVEARLGGSQVFDGGFATGDSFQGIEDLIGSDFDDTLVGNVRINELTGNAGDDFINGDRGNDIILGGDGNDTLIGSFGQDTLDGGDGIDQARYANANSRAVVDLSTGEGTAGHSFGDTLINIENLFGSVHNDVFTGDAGDNVLNGGLGGVDRLTGGEGNDTLIGGNGNDRFIFTDGWDNDTVTDFEDGGDLLDFRTVTGVDALSDLLVSTDGNGDAVISFGSDSVTLEGIDAADIDAGDFLF